MCGSKRLWFFLGALALTTVCLPKMPILAQESGTSQSDAIIDSVGGTVSSSNNITEEMKEELSETAAAIKADGLTEGSLTDGEIANSSYAAHNAWMLICCALVLFMTAPGLALFYGGLVRRKNVLSVMMQCIFLMGLMTVIWATYGYSLAFGGDGGWIGNGDYLLMSGV